MSSLSTNDSLGQGLLTYDGYWEGRSDFHRFHPGIRHRRRWIIQQLIKIKGSSLLEVGCGPAGWLKEISEKCHQFKTIFGVDYSRDTIALNQKNFPQFQFQFLNIEQEFLNQKFDVIIFSEVIEHLKAQEKAVFHLSQMLNPGGKILLTCPLGKVYATEKAFGHTVHPTLNEIKNFSNNAGLTVTQAKAWGWPFYAFQKWATNLNSEWAMQNFASGNYGWKQRAISEVLYWINFLNLPIMGGPQLYAVLSKPSN
jgi:SAM-dependent methyltransferase